MSEKLSLDEIVKPVLQLFPRDIEETLETVRSMDGKSFRDDELAWLDKYNFMLKKAILELFEADTRSNGPEEGQATMFGALYASFLVRHAAQAHGVDYQIIKDSTESNIAYLSDPSIPDAVYRVEIEALPGFDSLIKDCFGKEVLDAIEEVKMPARKTAMSVILLAVRPLNHGLTNYTSKA